MYYTIYDTRDNILSLLVHRTGGYNFDPLRDKLHDSLTRSMVYEESHGEKKESRHPKKIEHPCSE